MSHPSSRGRRRVREADQRSHNRNVKFNLSELSIAERNAESNNMSLSEYMRTAALGGDTDSESKAIRRDLVRALSTASEAAFLLSEKAYGRGGAIGKEEAKPLVEALMLLIERVTELREAI